MHGTLTFSAVVLKYHQSISATGDSSVLESFNGIVIEDDQTVDQRVDVRNLQVYGRAVFCEDVEADEIEVFGSSRFRSFLSCDRLSVTGEAVVLDGLLAESVRVDGSLNVSGRFRSDVVVVDGTLTASGKYSGARLLIRSKGRVDAAAPIKAERLNVNGAIYTGSVFSGENLEILSCEHSEIARVRVIEASVKYKPRGDVPEIREGEYLLSSYYIEAQNANLEYVSADSLECDSAYIGPGCRIGEIIYKNDIEIDKRSVVERLYRI